jgi:hypothetical protein
VVGATGRGSYLTPEFAKRFMSLSDLKQAAWLNPEGDVAVIFPEVSAIEAKDAFHVVGEMWSIQSGEPRHLMKFRYDMNIALLLGSYAPDKPMLAKVSKARMGMEEELRRLRIAQMQARAHAAVEDLKIECEMKLAEDKESWLEYMDARKASQEIRDSRAYQEMLARVGIHGEGWYLSSDDLGRWAQIVSVNNVSSGAVWYREWERRSDGEWSVRTLDAPPLVFAAKFGWYADLPGTYRMKDTGEVVEIGMIRGSPPILTVSVVNGGTSTPVDDLATLPSGTWTKEQRIRPAPLPAFASEQLRELGKKGRVWFSRADPLPSSGN